MSLLQILVFSFLATINIPVAYAVNQIINGDFQSHSSFNANCSMSVCNSHKQSYQYIFIASGNYNWFTLSNRSYQIRSKLINGLSTSVLDIQNNGNRQVICQSIQVKRGYKYGLTFDGVLSDHYTIAQFQIRVENRTTIRRSNITANFYQQYKFYNSNLTALLCLTGETNINDGINGPLFDNVTFQQIGPFCNVQNCTKCIDMRPNNCQVCQIGFYLRSSSCEPCSDAINNCMQCPHRYFCSQCTPGYIFLIANKTCIVGNTLCYSNILNCQQCISNYSCFQCISPFTVSQNKTVCFECSIVIPNCLNCLNQFQCAQCKPGYIFNQFIRCILPIAFQIEKIYESTDNNNQVIIQTNLLQASIKLAEIVSDQFIQVIINSQNQIIINSSFNQAGFLNVNLYLASGHLSDSNILIKIVKQTPQSNYYLYFQQAKMISIQKYSDTGIECMNAIESITINGLYKVLAPTVKWLKYSTLGSLINPVFNSFNMASFYGYSFYTVKMPKNIKISLQHTFQLFKVHGIFEILKIDQNLLNYSRTPQKIKASPFPWKGKLDFSFSSDIIVNNIEPLFILSLFLVRIIILDVLYRIIKWRLIDVTYTKFTMVSIEYQSFTPYFLISVGSYIATQISAVDSVEKFKILFQMIFLAISLLIPFFQFVNSYINSEFIYSNKRKIVLRINRKLFLSRQTMQKQQKQINLKIKKQLKKVHLEELLSFTQNISVFAIPFCIAIENRIALTIVGTLVMILRIGVTLASFKLFPRTKFTYVLSLSIIWTTYHAIFVCFYVMQAFGSYQSNSVEELFQVLGFIGICLLPLIGILPTTQMLVNLFLQTKVVVVQFLEQYKQKNRIDPNNTKDISNFTASKEIQGIFNFKGEQKVQNKQIVKHDFTQGVQKQDSFTKTRKKRVNFKLSQSKGEQDLITPDSLPTQYVNNSKIEYDSSLPTQYVNNSKIEYDSPLVLKIKSPMDQNIKRKPYLSITYHDF